MEKQNKLKTRLDKLSRWNDRLSQFLGRVIQETEAEYVALLKDLDDEKNAKEEAFKTEEESHKLGLEAKGKEFVREKYVLERDTNVSKSEIERHEQEAQKTREYHEAEITRLSESRTKTVASFERQKTALTELYQDKKRNLMVTRAKLSGQLRHAQENLRQSKVKFRKDMDVLSQKNEEKLNRLREQRQAKQAGWEIALESMRKELAAVLREKDETQKRLAVIREETEKELNSIKSSMALSKEQLEVDKATLIEKAEEDQSAMEGEIKDLDTQVEKHEKELHDFVMEKDQDVKNAEEAFEQEEEAIKEAVRAESDKRDYEKKLFEQEKSEKTKAASHLKDEYEKKKWYWDHQVRNLMMQKSVQEAEFNAEKMRVNREARSALKSLEARRDELKQRVSEIKARTEHLKTHQKKERELQEQRWKWRKERLWSMWENRLAVIKKERVVLQDQLHALEANYLRERDKTSTQEERGRGHTQEIESSLLQLGEQNRGHRQQREIQIELEKTRLLAQIKECEGLITDWQDRLKSTQDEIDQTGSRYGDQLNFLEKLYREEERETGLFIHQIKRVLSSLEMSLGRVTPKEDAA